MLLFVLCGSAPASIEVYSLAFRKSLPTVSNFSDSSETDASGYILAFVRNTGTTDESFTPAHYNAIGPSQAVRVNGEYVDAIKNNAYPTKVRWWRIYPTTLKPGEVGCVLVKSKDPTWVAEGLNCTVTVKSTAGSEASITGTLITPDLRLGDVIPSADRKTLYVFVRNLSGSTSYTAIDQVRINATDVTAQSTIINGGAMAPRQIAIIKVQYPNPLALRTLLNIEVRGIESGGAQVWTRGSVRLVDSGFPIGTWSTDLPLSPWYSKNLGMSVAVYNADYRSGDRFHIGMIRGGANTSYPDGLDHTYISGNAYDVNRSEGGAWMVADEPDNGSNPSYWYAYQNTYYWDNTYTAPTLINLCKSKKFNEWGPIADIACEDQYAMGSAPNQIPTHYPWQALEYAECLKANVEPVRMWTWSQLAFSDWSLQPPVWGVDYQFWANVFAGSKGILHYRYVPGDENGGNSELIARAVSMFRKLALVRWTALYSEASDTVSTTTSVGTVRARALVGENAALVCVLNDTITNSSHTACTGTASYDVPNHIAIEVVQMVGENGLTTLSQGTDYTVSGRTVTIHFSGLDQESYVYYIGQTDTSPPSPPTALNASALASPENAYEINYRDARDNVGIYQYRIYVNGVQVATSRSGICQVTLSDPVNDVIWIKAEDGSGNLSEPAVYKLWKWDFSQDGYAEVWRKSTSVANLKVEGGIVSYDTLGNGNPDLEIQGGSTSIPMLLVDPARYGVMHMRFSNHSSYNQGRCQFYSAGWTNTAIFYTAPNSGMRDYYLKMYGTTNWVEGTVVTGLRFRAINNVSTVSHVDLDLIEFLPYHNCVPGKPGQPSTGLSATANPTMTWNWTASVDNGPSPVAYYRVQVSDGTNTLIDTTTADATPSFTYTVPAAGLAYKCYAWAIDTSGNTSPASGWGPVTYYDTASPGVPSELVAVALGPTSVQLTWDLSPDTQGPNASASGYKVYRDGAYLDSTTGTTYIDQTARRGTTHHYTVSAYDTVPLESAQSAPVSVTTPDPKIGDVKKLGLNEIADLAGKSVTAITSDGFYIQERDRSAGIRVVCGTSASIGDSVALIGSLGLASNYERVITVGGQISFGAPVPVRPVIMTNASVGGSSTVEYNEQAGTGQRGVTGGVGVNNIGLLVRTTGRVTWSDAGWFYVDDGSGLSDFSPYTGLRVMCGGIAPPARGDYVAVTGTSSILNDGANAYRCIVVRGESDIQRLVAPEAPDSSSIAQLLARPG